MNVLLFSNSGKKTSSFVRVNRFLSLIDYKCSQGPLTKVEDFLPRSDHLSSKNELKRSFQNQCRNSGERNLNEYQNNVLKRHSM